MHVLSHWYAVFFSYSGDYKMASTPTESLRRGSCTVGNCITVDNTVSRCMEKDHRQRADVCSGRERVMCNVFPCFQTHKQACFSRPLVREHECFGLVWKSNPANHLAPRMSSISRTVNARDEHLELCREWQRVLYTLFVVQTRCFLYKLDSDSDCVLLRSLKQC